MTVMLSRGHQRLLLIRTFRGCNFECVVLDNEHYGTFLSKMSQNGKQLGELTYEG